MSAGPRKSLIARATACDIAAKLVTGAKDMKSMRPAEREDLADSLRQAAEFMAECEPMKGAIALLLRGHRT